MREDWINAEMGICCNIKMGQSPPSATYNTEEKGLPFFQGKAEFAKIHPIVRKWCSKPKQIAEANDILLSVRAPVGATNIANQKCALGRGLAAIEYHHSHKYIFYYLNLIEEKLDGLGTGTTFKAISGGILKSQIIPLAPLPEQRAIVAKIEQLLSDLDNGIANLKTAKTKLEIYCQAVLKKAFEGELTNTINTSGELPEGWECVRLGEVISLNPKHLGKELINEDCEVQFVPMKLVDEVVDVIHLVEIRKLNEVQRKSYTYFADGDVLFAKVTPCMENGKIAVARNLKNGIGYGSSEFHVLRCSDKIINQYLFYYLVQNKFRSDAQHAMTGAVGLRRVPKVFLEEYQIPLPSIQEQIKVITAIETRLTVSYKLSESIDQSLNKSEALRHSILKKAFEGKLLSESELEACRQENDWEPADKLLERIKKEKVKSSNITI